MVRHRNGTPSKWYAIEMGIAQASALEQEFGTDVWGAVRFTLGLAPKKQGSSTEVTPQQGE